MMLAAPMLVAALTLFTTTAPLTADTTARQSDAAERCGPPSAAESLAVARARAQRAASPSAVVRPVMTTAAIRARIDAFARYAAQNAERHPDSSALALVLEAQGYLALGRPDAALVPARASVVLASTPRGHASETLAHTTLGEVLQSRGHADSALAHYDSAFAAITRPEQVRERGQLCNDLGIAYHDLGALDLARDHLERALALRTAIADSDGVGVTLNNIGRLQQTLGRPNASITSLEHAAQVHRALGDSVRVAAVLANLGYAYDLERQPARALEQYDASRNALRLIEHPGYQGVALLNLGRAHLALGHLVAARDDVTAGLALERQADDEERASWAYHDLGRVEIALGHLEPGLALLDRARQEMHRLGDRSREGSALYYIGLARQHAGGDANLEAAVSAYAEAMTARLDVGRTAGNDADRIMFAEQDVSLTSKWVLAWLALAPTVGADSAARASLAAAERGRARALLDLMQTNGERATAAQLGDMRATSPSAPTLSYLVTPHAVVSWLSLPDGRVRSMCRRVDQEQLDTLVASARAQLYADSLGRRHAIARVATMLGDSTDDTPRDCAPSLRGATDAASIRRTGALAAQSSLLLPANVLALLPDSGELVIVPHAQLALIPFAALPVTKSRGAAGPLGLRYALRYAPSLTMLAAVEAGAPRAVDGANALIVADPMMPKDPDDTDERPFDSLPSARATAAWLSSAIHAPGYLTDSAATVRAVRDRITSATLVHLGTHGRAYDTEDRARDSFIVLAGHDSSALFRVRDVLALPSLRAELVVLMACETGLGDLTESEGSSGMQRAFLSRGARSVLVSLWRVDPAVTALLMRAFYKNWRGTGGKSGKAEALRKAQDEVRRDKRADPNPYYWAGFQLVGAP